MDHHQRVGAGGDAVLGVDRAPSEAASMHFCVVGFPFSSGPLLADVGADHEDVLAVGQQQREAAELGGGGVVELRLLNLRRRPRRRRS